MLLPFFTFNSFSILLPVRTFLQTAIANAIKNLPKKNTWTFYDVEADVLYINFHQPALPADDSELTDDDILIRYQNDEIIGLTILNVNNRL